jgi:hypothetical protein
MLAPRHAVSTRRLFRYTIVAYAGSVIAPARAGELARLWLLKQRDGVPIADAAAATAPRSGEEHAGLILAALASPRLIPRIGAPEQVPPGERVWIRRQELPAGWPVRLQAPALEPWVLAEPSGAAR